MKLKPIKASIGTEVSEVNLADELSSADLALLRRKFHDTGLLLFRNQSLDEDQMRRFAKSFGRISRLGPVQHASNDGISYVSNTRPDGAFGSGELLFHSDMTHFATPPKGIMLYGVEVPSAGGATLFSNSAYVLEHVPPELRQRLEAAEVIAEIDYDSIQYNEEKNAQVEKLKASRTYHLVMDHPWSAQRILFLSQIRGRIKDVSEEESREIMDAIDRHVRNEDWMYRHQWAVGDLAFWDNFLVQHARDTFDNTRETRTLRRCVVAHEQEPETAPT